MQLKVVYLFPMDDSLPISYDFSSLINETEALHPSFFFLNIIKEAGLNQLINNVSAVSRELGISRKGFYDFIHGSTGISPLMAIRLADFFKKKLPTHKDACDYNYWWNLHSKWYFQNEIRKLCIKSSPSSYRVFDYGEFAAAEDSPSYSSQD